MVMKFIMHKIIMQSIANFPNAKAYMDIVLALKNKDIKFDVEKQFNVNCIEVSNEFPSVHLIGSNLIYA